jgi:hypothetical protein
MNYNIELIFQRDMYYGALRRQSVQKKENHPWNSTSDGLNKNGSFRTQVDGGRYEAIS